MTIIINGTNRNEIFMTSAVSKPDIQLAHGRLTIPRLVSFLLKMSLNFIFHGNTPYLSDRHILFLNVEHPRWCIYHRCVYYYFISLTQQAVLHKFLLGN